MLVCLFVFLYFVYLRQFCVLCLQYCWISSWLACSAVTLCKAVQGQERQQVEGWREWGARRAWLSSHCCLTPHPFLLSLIGMIKTFLVWILCTDGAVWVKAQDRCAQNYSLQFSTMMLMEKSQVFPSYHRFVLFAFPTFFLEPLLCLASLSTSKSIPIWNLKSVTLLGSNSPIHF